MPSHQSPRQSLATVSPVDRPVSHFQVDANGTSRYSFPLSVPPGTGRGNTPHLSLEFTQGLGNGALGVGWTLGGSSSILRLPEKSGNMAHATHALDGAKLFCISGQLDKPNSTYAPMVEDWRKVVYLDQNSGFLVSDSKGRKMQYGSTADSTTVTPDGLVIEWRLKTNTDRWGNCITYTYTSTPKSSDGCEAASRDSAFIDSVAYTSNSKQNLQANCFVQFFYRE